MIKKEALNDFNEARKIKELKKANLFNFLVCEGIKYSNESNFDKSIDIIDAAIKMFPSNKETQFYRISIKVAKYMKAFSETKLLNSITEDLDKFIKDKPSEHMLYYFRGILLLYKQEFDNALKDFNTAIEGCDSKVAKYHLGRARCYACLSMFKEAIEDLNISIETNDQLVEAYVLRGKCHFILGNTNTSFDDFKQVVKMNQEDPIVHVQAGNILMASGIYEQALKAYSNAYQMGSGLMTLLSRAKCYLALGNLKEAYHDLEKINHKNNNYYSDFQTLKILYGVHKDNNYSEGIKQFNLLIDTFSLKKSNLQEQMVQNGGPASDAELASGQIFEKGDLIVYRGVLKLYNKDYSNSIEVDLRRNF